MLPLAAGLPGSGGAAVSVGQTEGGFSMAEDRRRFRVFNVTLPLGSCGMAASGGGGGGGGGSAFDFLLGFAISFDTVMVNQLMWTFPRTPGYLVSLRTGEAWSWRAPLSMLSSQAAAAAAGADGDGVDDAFASAAGGGSAAAGLRALAALAWRCLLYTSPSPRD